MSLLTPDSGLLFWMLLSFGIVVFILCKFGFPVILKMVEQRKEYIEQSLDAARQANEQLANIQAESAAILSEAQAQKAALLKEAMLTKEQIISEAREQARAEGRLQMEKLSLQLQEEKEKAIQEIRSEIADLSVEIAEKVIRQKIEKNDEQQTVINRLLNEITLSKS